jgi:UDPglucose 6-dehydrogenase
VLVTEWEEFKNVDFGKIKKIARYPFIADGRNIYDKNKLVKMGIKYIGIGY